MSNDAHEIAAVKSAFDAIAISNLRYVTLGVAIFYVIFAIEHMVAGPPSLRNVMLPVELATIAILLTLYALIARGRIARARPHGWGALVALLLLGTDVIHYLKSQNPDISVYMMIVLIGVGAFFLSLEWFAILSSVILSAWLIPAIAMPSLRPSLGDFSVMFLTSLMLSFLIQTSRIRSLGELELSYLRLRRLSDAALEGIAICRDGAIVDVNESLCRTFGFERSELLGRRLEALLPEGLPRSGPVDGTGKRKNGESFPAELSANLIASGAEPLLAVAIRDVSERKRAEKLLEEQRLKMIYASKMTALGEMAAGIAHEIRNPLTSIMLRSELMSQKIDRGTLDEKEARGLLSQTGSDAARIAKIIAGLRMLARDAGENHFERCPLERIVEETLSVTAERTRRQAISLILEPIPPNLAIECRPTQVSQVLLNILGNAFDAVEGLSERWVRISFRNLGPEVEIRVTDSGTGIPPEIRERIMHPFFTTKGPSRGTGLGLSISHGLIASHHGTLELDPSSRHTSFVIRLPKEQRLGAKRAG